ncbi:MAG: hypothetical protein WC242_03185 [Candidatus Paceibacterota bacterium]|jgi:hypothetical protein
MPGENIEQDKTEGHAEETWTPEDERRIKEYESKRKRLETEIEKMGEFMDSDDEVNQREYYLDWLDEVYADVLKKKERIAATATAERERNQVGEYATQIRAFKERMRNIIEEK